MLYETEIYDIQIPVPFLFFFPYTPPCFIPVVYLLTAAFSLPLYIAENGKNVRANNPFKGCDSRREPPWFISQRQQRHGKPSKMMMMTKKEKGASG